MGVDFTVHCKRSLIPDLEIAKKSQVPVTPLKKPITKGSSSLKISSQTFMLNVDVVRISGVSRNLETGGGA